MATTDHNKVEPVEHNDTIVEDEKYDPKRDSDGLSINSAALGDDLPPGYFYSPCFLGALAVSLNLTSSTSSE